MKKVSGRSCQLRNCPILPLSIGVASLISFAHSLPACAMVLSMLWLMNLLALTIVLSSILSIFTILCRVSALRASVLSSAFISLDTASMTLYISCSWKMPSAESSFIDAYLALSSLIAPLTFPITRLRSAISKHLHSFNADWQMPTGACPLSFWVGWSISCWNLLPSFAMLCHSAVTLLRSLLLRLTSSLCFLTCSMRLSLCSRTRSSSFFF